MSSSRQPMRSPSKTESSPRQTRPGAGAASLRERLIDTAIGHVERHGLTVGLEQISLERVINESGVSRATAYRYFPSKSDFLTQVLTAVVDSTRLDEASDEHIEELIAYVQERLPDLESPQGRRDVVVEGLRRASVGDFNRIASSTAWHNYLAIRATCRGLAEGDLRTNVLRMLSEAEEGFTAQRAKVYAALADLLGYRLLPPLAGAEGFAVMAEAAGALMTGLVVRSLTPPTTPARSVRGAAFGSDEDTEWSMAAYHIVGLILSYLEPDPDVTWDRGRRNATARSLRDLLAIEDRMEDRPPRRR